MSLLNIKSLYYEQLAINYEIKKILNKINHLSDQAKKENGEIKIQSLPPLVLKKVYIDLGLSKIQMSNH